MQSNYIEVCIHTDVDSGEILGMLLEGETLGSWEKDGLLHIFWPEDRWNDAALADLKEVLGRFGVDASDRNLIVSTVPDRDWNAVWAASLKPIILGRRIRIRQSWNDPDPNFNGIELIIDPKRAFGTGYHVTTQLVVEWLEENIRGGERVLDVGTGSGILAMSAIRFGAISALGIDNDPVAIECAREYAAGNGFGSELKLQVSSYESLAEEPFDIIVANLDSRTMPLFCQGISRLLKPGGIACLSGIQDQDYEAVSANLQNLLIAKKRKREDWLALSIKGLGEC
jgi:ribosomal protein L11 methyltransferase